jgi:hypothetical protein
MHLHGRNLRHETGQDIAASSGLSRIGSNADVMTEVLKFLDASVPVAVTGGGDALRSIAEAALQLKAGQRTRHPELFLFSDWGEVQEYAEHDTAGQDLLADLHRGAQQGGHEHPASAALGPRGRTGRPSRLGPR